MGFVLPVVLREMIDDKELLPPGVLATRSPDLVGIKRVSFSPLLIRLDDGIGGGRFGACILESIIRGVIL